MIVLRWLYTIWSGLIFFLLLLLAVPAYFFADLIWKKKGLKYMLDYNELWVNIWATLSGIKLKVINQGKVDPQTSYIFVANHSSMADAVISNTAIQHAFSPLAKIEIGKMPLMGYLFRKSSVLVNRSDKESRKQSIVKMLDNAKQGISVLIFPEGTRNKNPEIPLKPFYSGAFKVAIETQMPIAPLVYVGAYDLMPNEKLPLQACTITAIYADPIETKGLTENDVEQLKEQVFKVMEDLLLKYRVSS